MNFALNHTYSWKEVARHWYRMANGNNPDEDWSKYAEDMEEWNTTPPKGISIWKLVDLPIGEVKPHYACDSDDAETIDAYIDYRKSSNSPFPPIIVEERDDAYYTLDGCHRLEAARKEGDKTVRAFIPWTTLKERVAARYTCLFSPGTI